MADDRTPEQRAADQVLTDAIVQATTAYGWEDGLLTEYVVITSHTRFNDAGDTLTVYGSIYREQSMPYSHILGLLRYATLRVERDILDKDDVS